MRARPESSEIMTTLPPRAITSWMFEAVFSKRSSGGARCRGARGGRAAQRALGRFRLSVWLRRAGDMLLRGGRGGRGGGGVGGRAGLGEEGGGGARRHVGRAIAELRGDVDLDRHAG